MKATQANRFLKIASPLGGDKLLIRSFQGHAELGRLFEYTTEVYSTDLNLDFDSLLGEAVTVSLELEADLHSKKTRYFNAYVTSIEENSLTGSEASYTLTLHPSLYFLQKSYGNKIFQEKTVDVILKEVISGDFKISDLEMHFNSTYPARDYCVQYQETAFDFISRLMEEEGIFYFFKHEKDKHILVLTDNNGTLVENPHCKAVSFLPQNRNKLDLGFANELRLDHTLKAGAYRTREFDYLNAKRALDESYSEEQGYTNSHFEHYEANGDYDKRIKKDTKNKSVGWKKLQPHESKELDTKKRQDLFEKNNPNAKREGDESRISSNREDLNNFTKLRFQELHALEETLTLKTDCRPLSAGQKFKLQDCAREELNKTYFIFRSEIKASFGNYQSGGAESQSTFENILTVVDHNNPFRTSSQTAKPKVFGLQTAVVTGAKGDEIYTDELARIKLQFHWDQDGHFDDNTSPWIRVSQTWAGNEYGSLNIPRIGQELWVSFVDGNPDRPIVVSRAYNSANPDPYPLPDSATMSTMKSNSSKGGSGFNEFRFEDKKGEEQIFLHAQKDFDNEVLNDSKTWIGNDKTVHIVRDQKEQVDLNKHSQVLGERSTNVDGEEHLLIKGDQFEWVKKSSNLSVTSDQIIKVKGDRSSIVKGNYSETVKGQSSLQVTKDMDVISKSNRFLEAGEEIHLKAGKEIVLESDQTMNFKVGGSTITISKSSIDINSAIIFVNSGGAAGSGSGASPIDPKEAQLPIEVKSPLEADYSVAGKNSLSGVVDNGQGSKVVKSKNKGHEVSSISGGGIDSKQANIIAPPTEEGIKKDKPKRIYGGTTLPCGGRDSRQCLVYKDPMTKHKDKDMSLKPKVEGNTVYPLEGTDGIPKTIIKFNERDSQVHREFNNKNYYINKDKNGFPEFTLFETYLGDEHINSKNDKEHFSACNARMKELLKKDTDLAGKLGLSETQIKFFNKETPAKKSPPGLTWHHHQDVGKMQLVDEKLHDRWGHIGGMNIWGGSRYA